MQVPTNITVCQGRVPHLQGTSKTVKADISSVFEEFLDFVLQISKKKLGNKAPLLELSDLTVKYNWWCGKSEPKKLPQLYDLEDEDDFDSIPFFAAYSNSIRSTNEGSQVDAYKQRLTLTSSVYHGIF